MPFQPASSPSRLTAAPAGWSRERWMRVALGALAAAQLAAFWMLCSQQVRKAQMRDMSMEVQRVAVADCLRYIPRATLSSCLKRVDPSRTDAAVNAGDQRAPALDAAGAAMSSAAVPVSYR